MFFVPNSPRWLFNNHKPDLAKEVLISIHGEEKAEIETKSIIKNIESNNVNVKTKFSDLFSPALRYIMGVGLLLGILQQVTGINAIYFYATSIFKQTGIGTDAAFSSGVLLSFTTVIFTLIAIYLVDRTGRRPLLLIGMTGIAISLLTCAYGFNQAKYKLNKEDINALTDIDSNKLLIFQDVEYDSDVKFKNEIKSAIGTQVYAKNEGSILEAAIEMNSTLVLLGILGFIACFAFSLGPIMWVMLSELFPNKFRGLAIGVIGFVNSFASWTIQQIFPWELSNLGSALTFLIYGLIALAGTLLFLKILPETKGKLDLLNYEFLHKRNMLFGTPEYVADKIHELKSELNLQNLQVWSNFPGVKHEDCMKSIKLFTEKVMPHFQDDKNIEVKKVS